MSKASQSPEFIKYLKEFNNIESARILPPKIQIKLEYLKRNICQEPETSIRDSQAFELLTPSQRNQIDEMSLPTKISVFCSIMMSMTIVKQIPSIKNQKCLIKKQKDARKIIQATISTDVQKNKLIFKLNELKKEEEFLLSEIKISKSVKQHKKKHVFGMTYKQSKYLLSFQQREKCVQIHQKLIQSIKTAKISNFRYDQRPHSVMFQQDLSFSSPQKEDRFSRQDSPKKPFHFSKQEEIQINQVDNVVQGQNSQEQHFQTVAGDFNKVSMASEYDQQILTIAEAVQNLEKEDLFDESKYTNHMNFQSGKIMINSQNQKKSKCTVLLHNECLQYVLQCYLKMNEWNSQIEEFSIINKIEANTYLIFLKLKKYSWISFQRQVYAIVNAFTKDGKQYMAMKSVQNPQELANFHNKSSNKFSKTLRADIRQIVQLQTRKASSNIGREQTNREQDNKQGEEVIMLTIVSEIDFKGFNSQEDHKNMSINLFKDLEFLPKFIKGEKAMGKRLCLFNMESPINQNKKGQQKNSSFQVSEQKKTKFIGIGNSMISSIAKKQDIKISPEYQQIDFPQLQVNKQRTNQFSELLFKISTSQDKKVQSVEQLVQRIQNKQHEGYFLKHKFDLNQHIDPKRMQHPLNDQNKIITHYYGYEIQKDGNYVFTNKQMLNFQRGYLKIIIKKVTAMIMAGQSIRNLSLPAQIFQPKSEVHRSIYPFKYAAKYLVPAAQATDPIEQIKLLTQFCLYFPLLNMRICKSFNPILGQTFSCRIGGLPIYAEQISHHPPITALLIKTQTFQFSGILQMEPKLGFNSFHLRNQKGFFVDFFKTNTSYKIKGPDIEIGGTMFGDRKMFVNQYFGIYQKNNSIYAQICYGKQKTGVYQVKKKIGRNDFIGGIFKTKKSFGQRFLKQSEKFQDIKLSEIEQKFGLYTGKWYGDIYFDHKIVKKVFDPIPNRIQIDRFVLPSDSSLRTDLVYIRAGQIKKANQQKQYLQNLQRRDKKLRQQYNQRKIKNK